MAIGGLPPLSVTGSGREPLPLRPLVTLILPFPGPFWPLLSIDFGCFSECLAGSACLLTAAWPSLLASVIVSIDVGGPLSLCRLKEGWRRFRPRGLTGCVWDQNLEYWKECDSEPSGLGP